jgi:ABC-2 type transport system permease protein/lipopolysaccharide transport system permease protein
MNSEAIENSGILGAKSSEASEMLTEAKQILLTIADYKIWPYIAWNDVRSRYRRTILGPFWLVLANAITIVGMGLIWSFIFKMDLKEYFPKLTAAMVCWTFISSTISESGNTFNGQGSIIQNLPVSIYLHPLRLMSRNIITFLHNFIIFIPVCIFYRLVPTVYTLLFIPFFFMVVFNLFLLAFILGVIGARYRDFPQVIISIMSVLIFVTPVMWDIGMLGKHYMLVYLNPLSHFIFILKMSLLGELPPTVSIIFMFSLTIINLVLMLLTAKKYSHRIPYWM